MKITTTHNIWDAIEDDPAARADLKVRSAIMMVLSEHIRVMGWDMATAAVALQTEVFAVECLLNGRISQLDRQTLAAMLSAAEVDPEL